MKNYLALVFIALCASAMEQEDAFSDSIQGAQSSVVKINIDMPNANFSYAFCYLYDHAVFSSIADWKREKEQYKNIFSERFDDTTMYYVSIIEPDTDSLTVLFSHWVGDDFSDGKVERIKRPDKDTDPPYLFLETKGFYYLIKERGRKSCQ